MSFDQHLLCAFQAVAEQGTVGRAARALNATQPTVSRQIRALEQQFGQPLFDRDSRGMHLTPAGAELLPRVRLLLYEMAAAQDLMDAHRGVKRGAIRVGGVAAIARALFPQVLAQLAIRAPELRIEVTVGSEDRLDRALADREIDLMFAAAYPREVDAVRLGGHEFRDRCVVFCAASNPLLKAAPITAAQVLGQRWAMPNPDASPSRQFEELVRKAGQAAPEIALQTESVELILAAVARSELVSWLPEPLLTDALASGEIALVPVPELELARSFTLYRRARGTFPESAQRFIDALASLELAAA